MTFPTNASVHETFNGLIRHAIKAQGKTGAVKLGNVEFQLEGDDLVYSLPVSQWDIAGITVSLTSALLKPGLLDQLESVDLDQDAESPAMAP